MPETKRDIWNNWVSKYVIDDVSGDSSANTQQLFELDNQNENINIDDRDVLKSIDSESCIYIFYTLKDSDQPSVDSIIPLYIGNTDENNRISTHKREIRDVSDDIWTESATSDWNKYRHLLAATNELDSSCYIWAKDMMAIEECPYGYHTNQYDLEAKLIGLAIHQDRFRRTLANLKDSVPKKIRYERNKSGPKRIRNRPGEDTDIEPRELAGKQRNVERDSDSTKVDLWQSWLDSYVVSDINDSERADPICLLKTRENIAISRKNNSGNRRLKLSERINDRIDDVRNKLLDTDTYLGTEGALYVMYRIDSTSENIDSTNIIPLYVGLSEAHSHKFTRARSEVNNQLQDFTDEEAKCGVARDRFSANLTDEKKRLRWGSAQAYHIGKLSLGLWEPDHRYANVNWAKSIFTDDGWDCGTPELSDEVYLWMHPWSRAKDDGPYHPNTMLNEVEPQLIELAAAAHPKSLLNDHGESKNN